jgi:hypothetical protein
VRRMRIDLPEGTVIMQWPDALLARHGTQRAALEAGLQACHVANPIKSGGK